MELQPADARAAPSACAPTTLSMAMPLPTTHPRSPGKGNMVSQSATPAASAWREHEHKKTPPVRPHRRTSQSLPEPCTSHHPYGSVFQVCRLQNLFSV
eukprot:scaffold8491_cov138-Isochrysis_galbana.AAC.2